MDLPEQYRRLITEYDQVLNLSRKILEELKKGGKEDDLEFLLNRKKVVAEGIARLTEQIASTGIRKHAGVDFRGLTLVKDLLKQATEKAKLLQKVEDQIQDLIRQKNLESK